VKRICVALPIALALMCGCFTSSAQAATPKLTTLLARSNEMTGYVTASAAFSSTSASKFVSTVYQKKGAAATQNINALKADGFVEGVSELLMPKSNPRSGQGFSEAFLFKTSAGAKKSRNAQYAPILEGSPKGSTLYPLNLGIPGALTYSDSLATPPAGASDVFFTVGRCVIALGDERSGDNSLSGPPLVAAAKVIAKRAGKLCGAG
jgi:hypothetical protein